MEEVSVTDQLTGLKNRYFLNQYIHKDISKIHRDYDNQKRGIKSVNFEESVHIFFILDLDHFKQVNDTYGHAAGDQVLIQIRNLLTDVFRDSDFLIRWGGEEFLAIARFTRSDCGEVLAERIRGVIEQHEFNIGEGQTIKMTSSIGFAAYPFYSDSYELLTWQQVVKVADQCLYYAKNHKRNAWVGGYPSKDFIADEFMQVLLNEPQSLLQTPHIQLTTSIKN